MGFDPERIALVREAFRLATRPITDRSPLAPAECVIDGRARPEDALTPLLARPFAPPSGWKPLLERAR
jgi:hypothetical protein